MDLLAKQQILSSRCYFYRLFAELLYRVPTATALRAIVEDEMLDKILADDQMATDEMAFFSALKEMRQYQLGDWEALKQEYVRLFADAAHIVVCPWESVYRSREHIIFDEHTLAVQEFYRQWGIAASDRTEGPADHIGLECSFLAYLSETAVTAMISGDLALAQKNLTAQRVFLEEHLCLFLEDFCTALQAATPNQLYRNLSIFLRAYVLADLAIVNDLLDVE